MPARLRERPQDQPVMFLGDLAAGSVESLRVLLESPAQYGLLTDRADHGMQLHDSVRVLPPGSPTGGMVHRGADGGPAAALTCRLPSYRLTLKPAPRVSCRRLGERQPIPGQRPCRERRDVPIVVHSSASRGLRGRCSLRRPQRLKRLNIGAPSKTLKVYRPQWAAGVGSGHPSIGFLHTRYASNILEEAGASRCPNDASSGRGLSGGYCVTHHPRSSLVPNRYAKVLLGVRTCREEYGSEPGRAGHSGTGLVDR